MWLLFFHQFSFKSQKLFVSSYSFWEKERVSMACCSDVLSLSYQAFYRAFACEVIGTSARYQYSNSVRLSDCHTLILYQMAKQIVPLDELLDSADHAFPSNRPSSQSSPYSIHYSRRAKELFTIYANLPIDLLSHQSVLVLCAKTSSSACCTLTFIDNFVYSFVIYV